MSLKLDDAKRRQLAALRSEIRRIERPAWLAQRAERKADRSAMTKRVGKRETGQRQVRETDGGFLAYVRRQPCEAGHLGGCGGPVQAAHIRYSDVAKGSVNPGMQRKNHDKFCNPLCDHHHNHDQHQRAERAFWSRLGKDAYDTAAAHFAAYSKGSPE